MRVSRPSRKVHETLRHDEKTPTTQPVKMLLRVRSVAKSINRYARGGTLFCESSSIQPNCREDSALGTSAPVRVCSYEQSK